MSWNNSRELEELHRDELKHARQCAINQRNQAENQLAYEFEKENKRLESDLARALDLLTQWLMGNGDKMHGQTSEFLKRMEERDNPPRGEKRWIE